ncbi:hypothetical protein [Kordiimonas marina]|uniref:hypothetical protein n=1 Tax=Kordiimonas marina TaxID=2872312 RepID=UPI003CCFEC5A
MPVAQTMPPKPEIAASADWLPHRYDPVRDAVHFHHIPRALHRGATFLTDDHLPTTGTPAVIGSAEAMAAAQGVAGPIHYIFHSAYCCSTLLARAVDIDGVAMGLKEPVILNDMVGWRHRGGAEASVKSRLDMALTLLARPFSPGEATVVKPSNLVNGLAPAMLDMRPGARALLLHAPLRAYLASIAKKGMWGRLWVRDLLIKLLKEGRVNLGIADDQYLALTDIQVAAVGWLAQHDFFTRLARHYGPARVRTLDSETLLDRPAEVMVQLNALFGLGLSAEAAGAIATGPAFTRHSKLGGDFGAEDHRAENETSADHHADEIEKVAKWAEAIAKTAGIEAALPNPIL